MVNPILQAMSKMQPQATQAVNNPLQLLAQFAEFKRQMVGKNPQAMVEQLLQSGKMSHQQFEQLKQQATMMQTILK